MFFALSALLRRTLGALPGWGWGLCAVMALIGGMVTWSAFKHSSELESQAIEAGLNREVDETVEELLVRIQAHEQLLLSAAALLQRNPDLDQDGWREFAQAVRLPETYPGVRALGYAQWQDKQTAPITRLVPLDEASRPAMAYDLMSDPVRRSALIRARDLGLPVMSGEVTLKSSEAQARQPASVMYVPVYRLRAPNETLEHRRQAIQGWVFSPYLFGEFMEVVEQHVPNLVFEVFDGREVTDAALLYGVRRPQATEHHQPAVEVRRTVVVGQREWTLRFQSLPQWEATHLRRPSRLYLILGGLVTSAGVVMLGFLIGHRAHALRLVQKSTRALGVSEAKYKQLVEAQSDLIAVIGLDGSLRYLNPAAARFLGQPAEALVGRCFYDLIWATEAELLREHVALLIERRVEGLAEHRMLDGRGREHWMAWTCTLQESASDADLQVHLVGRDMTERHLLESRLKDREQRYRGLFENLQSGFALNEVILDDAGRVVDFRFLAVNEAFERITGWPGKAILGRTIRDLNLIEPQELEVWLKQFGRVALGRGNVQFERRSRTFDRWLDIVVYRPATLQFALVMQDVTERHEAQEALQARAEAEAASLAKTQFLANMSHEIRTPLNAVLGCAQIGLRDHSDASGAVLFRRIRDAGQHLLGVVNDILDFSKVESGKFEIDARPTRLRTVVNAALDMVRDKAAAKRLDLVCAIADAVPEWLMLDAMRLEQILVNLLSNAVKFTQKGHVHMLVEEVDGQLRLAVSDSGLGMSEEQIARVFKPFEQADKSTTRQFGGTGLGLTISANLARLLGGALTVKSQSGIGSTFILTLPMVEAQAQVLAESPELSGQPLRGVRALIVDDVEVNRLILEDMLQHWGAEVFMAEDGQQAIDQVQLRGEGGLDVVLMDIQMPVMDGITAAEHLRQMAPHLPVIAMTAHAFKQERDRCLEAGMVDHISKPIDEALLIRTLAARCGGLSRAGVEVAAARAQQVQADRVEQAEGDKTLTGSALSQLDWDGLVGLYGRKPGLLQRAVQSVLQHNHNTPVRLREAAAEQDWDTLVFVAHSLKGVAGNIRAEPLRVWAADTEMAARQHAPDALERAQVLADGLAGVMQVLAQRLEAWQAASSGSAERSTG